MDMFVWTIISGIIGVLGFILSAINFIYIFVKSRCKFEIELIESSVLPSSRGAKITARLQFNNLSQLPVSITDLKILVDGNKYRVDDLTHKVLSYENRIGKEVVARVPTYNSHIPVTLDSLGSYAGYFVFLIPRNIPVPDGKILEFEVHSNRGLVIQPTLSLNHPQIFPKKLQFELYKNRSK